MSGVGRVQGDRIMKQRDVRLAPLAPHQWSAEQAEILEPTRQGKGLGRGVINVFATVVRHPKLCKRWFVFATHVLFKTTLVARDRELLILRIAWLCGSAYEWGQHMSIGRDAGLSEAEISRIKQGADAPGWAPHDALLVRATDELHGDACLTDETWAALTAHYNEQQILDLIFTVGQYNMLAMVLNSCGVPLDEDAENY
jgi:alkylhydroperoxidase family enzyme